MNKSKKDHQEPAEPALPEEEFEETEEVSNIEDFAETEDDKAKTVSKHAYETRRKLEDLLEQRKRRKEHDYFFNIDNNDEE